MRIQFPSLMRFRSGVQYLSWSRCPNWIILLDNSVGTYADSFWHLPGGSESLFCWSFLSCPQLKLESIYYKLP